MIVFIKNLWQSFIALSVVVLSLFCFLLSTTLASGVVHVKIGETLNLQPSNVSGKVDYSWILKKGEEIIPQGESGVTNSSAKTFEHVFTEPGEYEVRLLMTDPESGATQTTITLVKADILNPNFEDKQVSFTTLPPLNSEGVLVVDPASPEVTFFPGNASGNPSEYWIDTDITEDADGDGIADNDKENASHSSFFTGSAWSHTYDPSKPNRTAQITVKYPTGETESKTLDISFDQTGVTAQKSLPLKAVLNSLPRANEDGLIYLPGKEGNVTFFAGNSEGNIVEYRIDKNALFDTNADGTPDNDIDNREHNSFRTGSSWTTNFKKEWGEVVIELLVVNDQNKGSKVQRKIIFDTVLAKENEESGAIFPALPQKLVISQQEIFAGESVDFMALGLPEGAQITWDFDGDGVSEYEGIRTRNTYQYNNDGIFPVKITAHKDGEVIAEVEKIITVLSSREREIMTSPPTAQFSSSVNTNTVSFGDESFADNRLLNTDLSYSWDFGDGKTSSEVNPEHIYAQAQTYTTILTVTDAVGRSTTTAENIAISSVAPGSVPDDAKSSDGDTSSEESGKEKVASDKDSAQDSDQVSGEAKEKKKLGWLWWTLILLLGIPLLLLAFYLIFRKIRYPDLSFEEIVLEDFDRIRHKKHAEIAQVTQIETSAAPVPESSSAQVATAEIVTEDVPSTPKKESTQNTASTVQDESPSPTWLKTEGQELEKDSSTSSKKGVQSAQIALQDESTPVPDWLQETRVEASVSKKSSGQALSESAGEGEAKTEIEPQNITTESYPIAEDDMPDWLKEDIHASAQEASESEFVSESSQDKPADIASEQSNTEDPPRHNTESSEEDLPDWMK